MIKIGDLRGEQKFLEESVLNLVETVPLTRTSQVNNSIMIFQIAPDVGLELRKQVRSKVETFGVQNAHHLASHFAGDLMDSRLHGEVNVDQRTK